MFWLAKDTSAENRRLKWNVPFQQNIGPLSRDRDIRSISFAFDLSSYEEVHTPIRAAACL